MNETHSILWQTVGKGLITILIVLGLATPTFALEKSIEEIVEEVSAEYDVDKFLISAIIEHESRGDPTVSNGSCKGLMQVDNYWHKDRAERLDISDWYDPESNIILGTDYLAELFEDYEDYSLVVMLYATNHDEAFDYYDRGIIEPTAMEIIDLAEQLRLEV